jgi:hypothetical protein
MSIPVQLEALHDQLVAYERAPYLLTVSDDGRPHSVAVPAVWRGDELAMLVGKRTAANATARPRVSLVFAPGDPAGYSLIVDASVTGCATTDEGEHELSVRPTGAVLHRPATSPGVAKPCGADCVSVLRTEAH